jgi:hypothetical protein
MDREEVELALQECLHDLIAFALMALDTAEVERLMASLDVQRSEADAD